MLTGNELLAMITASRLAGKFINPAALVPNQQQPKRRKIKTFKSFHKNPVAAYGDRMKSLSLSHPSNE